VYNKEVIYDYIRATNLHFVNDSAGFVSEIEDGVFKTNTYGSSWDFFCFQGDFHYNNDDYNAMYFISEDLGYFACYTLSDTIAIYKLIPGNTEELLRIGYDSASHDYMITDTITLEDYFCENLDHLLFTFYIQDDTIVVDLQFFNNYVAGLNDAALSAIQVYPNPSSDNIYIQNAGFSSEYRIYNINGALLKQARLESSSKVSIRDLTKGVYLLEIITDKWTMTKKIVRI
jgi:hypothetical protein